MKKESKLNVVHFEPKKNDDAESSLYKAIENLPAPDSRANLTATQKFWWYWLGALLVETKDFAEVDLVHLQKAAFWMDVRCQAIGKVNDKGYDGGIVQTFSTGARQISPDLSAVEKADKHLDEISQVFGWSILHRKKIGEQTQPDGGQMDLFDEMLKMKKQG